jgi:hypothetical protein
MPSGPLSGKLDAASNEMMDLRLKDPNYTERLASFLKSLGQKVVVAGPDTVELIADEREGAQAEVDIYLRVWNVLYPDAHVTMTP